MNRVLVAFMRRNPDNQLKVYHMLPQIMRDPADSSRLLVAQSRSYVGTGLDPPAEALAAFHHHRAWNDADEVDAVLVTDTPAATTLSAWPNYARRAGNEPQADQNSGLKTIVRS